MRGSSHRLVKLPPHRARRTTTVKMMIAPRTWNPYRMTRSNVDIFCRHKLAPLRVFSLFSQSYQSGQHEIRSGRSSTKQTPDCTESQRNLLREERTKIGQTHDGRQAKAGKWMHNSSG